MGTVLCITVLGEWMSIRSEGHILCEYLRASNAVRKFSAIVDGEYAIDIRFTSSHTRRHYIVIINQQKDDTCPYIHYIEGDDKHIINKYRLVFSILHMQQITHMIASLLGDTNFSTPRLISRRVAIASPVILYIPPLRVKDKIRPPVSPTTIRLE